MSSSRILFRTPKHEEDYHVLRQPSNKLPIFCVRSQHVQCCIYTTCIIHIFRTEAMNAFISTLVTGFHLWKRLLGLRLPCRSRVSICSVASSPPSSASISSPPASTSASHSIPSPLLPLLIPFSPLLPLLIPFSPLFPLPLFIPFSPLLPLPLLIPFPIPLPLLPLPLLIVVQTLVTSLFLISYACYRQRD